MCKDGCEEHRCVRWHIDGLVLMLRICMIGFGEECRLITTFSLVLGDRWENTKSFVDHCPD